MCTMQNLEQNAALIFIRRVSTTFPFADTQRNVEICTNSMTNHQTLLNLYVQLLTNRR